MNKIRFKEKLSKIKSATSVTGKEYKSIQVVGDNLEFVREGKTQPEDIPIDELFELYTKENFINTSVAKRYISGRVQSPAVAIINELKQLLNDSLYVSTQNGISKKENKKPIQSYENEKDENRFFNALSELVGKDYLISKSIGKPINSSHIFLSNNVSSK